MTKRTELMKQLIEYTINIRASNILSVSIVEQQVFKAGFTKKEFQDFLIEYGIEEPKFNSPRWKRFGCFIRTRYYEFPENWGGDYKRL